MMRRLNMELTDHDYEKSVVALGINSIAAVELSNDLQSKTGQQFELLPLFEQYTLNQLITFLSDSSPIKDLKWNQNITIAEPLVDSLSINHSSKGNESVKLIEPPSTFGLRNAIQNPDLNLDDDFIGTLKAFTLMLMKVYQTILL